jgi:DNA-binding NarL/FixJ family response regulator
MPKKIGVANTPPVYTLGLAGALSHGQFEIEDAIEPREWIERDESAVLLLGVTNPDDLKLVVDLTATGHHHVVVTIVDRLDSMRLKACLDAGAVGAVDLTATPEEVAIVLEGALMGKTVLSATLARDLTESGAHPGLTADLTNDEQNLLDGLVSGKTIHQLGDESGYSDREIHRRLQRVYRKFGVSGRIEAIVKVASSGMTAVYSSGNQTKVVGWN